MAAISSAFWASSGGVTFEVDGARQIATKQLAELYISGEVVCKQINNTHVVIYTYINAKENERKKMKERKKERKKEREKERKKETKRQRIEESDRN